MKLRSIWARMFLRACLSCGNGDVNGVYFERKIGLAMKTLVVDTIVY